MLTDDYQEHDQTPKISNHNTNLCGRRSDPTKRFLHDTGVGCCITRVCKPHQELHRHISQQSNNQDQQKRRYNTEDLKRGRNGHDAGTDYAR